MEVFLWQLTTGLLTLDNTSRNFPKLRASIPLESTKNIPGQYWDSAKKAVNLQRNRNFLPEPGQLPFCHNGTENLVAPQVS